MKKAIKKLNAEVIELANAIKADRKDIVEITIEQNKQIEKLDKRVSNIIIQRENDIEKELLKEQVKKLQFLVNSKNGSIDALSNKLGNLKSDVQTIAKHVQNLEAEKCSCHTNTQKTDKNAAEGKQEGKKEQSVLTWFDESSELTQEMFETLKLKARSQAHYETELKKAYDNCFKYYDKTGNVVDKPEVIVTNEMFNEELEGKLKKNILEYHPAFMLLNGVIPSNLIEDLIRAKLKSKGEHYSPNGDRYSNFKRLNNSTTKQKTVKERIENFMEKHEIWIEDYQAGDVSGTLLDLIESCIDVLCYYLLLDIYLKFNGEA